MIDVAFAYTHGLPAFVGFFANDDDDDDDDLSNLSQYGRGFVAIWTSHTSVAESCHLLMMMMVLLTNVSCHAFIGDDRIWW